MTKVARAFILSFILISTGCEMYGPPIRKDWIEDACLRPGTGQLIVIVHKSLIRNPKGLAEIKRMGSWKTIERSDDIYICDVEKRTSVQIASVINGMGQPQIVGFDQESFYVDSREHASLSDFRISFSGNMEKISGIPVHIQKQKWTFDKMKNDQISPPIRLHSRDGVIYRSYSLMGEHIPVFRISDKGILAAV